MEDMWQRNATLQETNLRMLKDEIMCDVTFLAGESRRAVKAHKYMLVSRSPVFFAMFYGSKLAETSDEIAIPDIEVDMLQELLRYIYIGAANITLETVMALMYAANKYDVAALVNDCRNFIKSNATPENVCTIFEQAYLFDDKSLLRRCQKIVEKNADAVLDSEAFLLLSSTGLRRILSMEQLRTSEEQLFTSCVKWAKEECTRREKEENDANCREVLGDMLYLIRFPCMSSDNFTKLTWNSGILSAEEKVDVFQNLCSQDIECVKFSGASRRNPTSIRIDRFDDYKCEPWDSCNGTDSINFSCTSDAVLTGIGIYDSTMCTLKLLKQDGKTPLFVTNLRERKSSPGGILEVKFTNGIRLKKCTSYEIVQDNWGTVPRFGIHGKAVVTVDDFTVNFFSSPSTYSVVEQGQIPSLYFEV